jgi:hypothetical protein
MNYQTWPGKKSEPCLQHTQSKKDWRCGSSGRAHAFQGQSCKFKSQYLKKKKDWPRLEVGTVTPSSPGPAYNCNPSTPEVSGIPLSQICFMDYKRISRDFQFIQFQGYLFF